MHSTFNFEKWAEGKHPLLALIAHTQIAQAQMAYVFTKEIHENDMFFGDFPTPDLDTWLRLFRTHPSATTYITQTLGDPNGFLQSTNGFLEQFDENAPIKKTDISSREAKPLLEKYLNTLNALEENLEQTISADEAEKFFLAPEFYFFFRVYLPCWLTHYTTPAQLLRKARLRDFDSLKQLIKLDPSTIFDKKIARFIHSLRSKNRPKYEQILATLQNKSKSQITKQKFKVFYAAIITSLSIGFGERLTEPDVRGLFDAVARDKGIGEIDTDLPDSPHTFYMAMKRHIDASL